MTESEIRRRLRAWIAERTEIGDGELSDDTPLLESGLLTSLGVVELILFVEQLRGGEELSIETLEPESIRDVSAIYRSFFT